MEIHDVLSGDGQHIRDAFAAEKQGQAILKTYDDARSESLIDKKWKPVPVTVVNANEHIVELNALNKLLSILSTAAKNNYTDEMEPQDSAPPEGAALTHDEQLDGLLKKDASHNPAPAPQEKTFSFASEYNALANIYMPITGEVLFLHKDMRQYIGSAELAAQFSEGDRFQSLARNNRSLFPAKARADLRGNAEARIDRLESLLVAGERDLTAAMNLAALNAVGASPEAQYTQYESARFASQAVIPRMQYLCGELKNDIGALDKKMETFSEIKWVEPLGLKDGYFTRTPPERGNVEELRPRKR